MKLGGELIGVNVAGIVDEVGKSIVRVGKLGVGREPLVEP